MNRLKAHQKKYLRSLAHALKPVVFIGQKGVTDTVIHSMNQALERHELIKVRFIDFKEKDRKREITGQIEAQTGCQTVGMIGHVWLCYRQNEEPEKRKIILPDQKD